MDPSEALTMSAAAKLIPSRSGKTVHRKTVIRWIRKGCRGVRLEGWMHGGNWFTTEAALQRFSQELTSRAVDPVVSRRTPAERAARVRKAREELERNGFFGKRKPTAE